MYHYSILQPLKLNWKYTAPRSFTEMELFITPTLSLGIERMSNGKNDFSIGAYLTGGMDRGAFDNIYLVKRSTERVQAAFNKEEVSVFFTPTEAQEMEKLFEDERFIARQVRVMKNGQTADLFALDEEDFERVMTTFTEMGVQQSIDFQTEREAFTNLRTDMYEAAFKEAKTAFFQRNKLQERVTKKELYIQGGMGGALIIGGALLKKAGKILMTKGFFGALAGGLCYLASTICGIVGLKCVNGAAEYYTQGVVFE